jgi:hypothetical protein
MTKLDCRHNYFSVSLHPMHKVGKIHLINILAAFIFIGTGVMNALTCIAKQADINVMDKADNAIPEHNPNFL